MMKASAGTGTRSIEFFSCRDLDEVPEAGHGPGAEQLALSFRSEEDREAIMAGNALFAPHMKSFAVHFSEVGLHIGILELAPGLMTPLHSHGNDCVYYVERGSVVMGNRILGPGEGFLVRKDQPYGFAAGPEGLRLIEFTHGPRTDIAFHDRNPWGWVKRLEKAVGKLAVGGATQSGVRRSE